MDLSEVKHLPKVDHTPAKLDAPSKLLLKAAALIEKHGHCQTGSGQDEDGRMCVLVAIARIPGKEGAHNTAVDRLTAAVPHVRPRGCLHQVALWSDRTPTAEVLAKLRAVALGL